MKRRVQDVIITLLSELDQMCREMHLKYYLSPELTWYAVENKKLPSNPMIGKIFMPVSDMEKLRRNFDQAKYPRRYMDSPASNLRFPDICLYYQDLDTIYALIDKPCYYRYPSLGIMICPLCRKKSGRICQKLVKAARRRTDNMEKGKIPTPASAIYRNMVFVYRTHERGILVADWEKINRVIFYENLFAERRIVLLSGYPFNVPYDTTSYIHTFYKTKGLAPSEEYYKENPSEFISMELRAEDYLREIPHMSDEEIRKRAEYDRLIKRDISANEVRNKVFGIVEEALEAERRSRAQR